MVYFVLTALMFSVFEVTSKNLEISPYSLTALRFFIGGITILPFSLVQYSKSISKINLKGFVKIWMLGLLLMSSCILLQIALVNTTVSLCVFIYCLNAVFGTFTGWIILKQRPPKSIWITCIISLIGLVILIEPFKFGINIYAVAALASSILFSLFNTLMFKARGIYGNLITTSISFLTGAATLGIILFLTGESLVAGVNGSNIFRILFIGIICSGTVYLAYYKTMEVTSVSLASTVFLIKPVIATLLSVVFLKEKLTGAFYAGSVLIFIGVSITIASKLIQNRKVQQIQQNRNHNESKIQS
ncbi:MAG TPA: EamA family transporter [Clostridiaceae bacterium]|nr:EamA family transporter [Clostridiaceae bacterium]